jgi:hypothetical protein
MGCSCKVIDAENVIAHARALVEAIAMAASDLPERQESAIGTVAELAIDKLIEARDLLDSYRADRERQS